MKKLFTLLLAFTLCVCTVAPAWAVTHDTDLSIDTTTVGETIRHSPAEYTRAVTDIRVNATDEDKIAAVCQTFLSMSRASVRDDAYDTAWLIADGSLDDPTVQYHRSVFAYDRAADKYRGVEIQSDSLSFSDFKAQVNGDAATASVVASYTYYKDEGFDDDFNFLRREYRFGLTRENDGSWKITRITSSAPWETDDFAYQAIDIEEAIQGWTSQPVEQAEKPAQPVGPQAVPYPTTSYHYPRAQGYARQWFDGINPIFGEASSDCQNFASQCIWAGLCSSDTLPTSSRSWPAIPSSRVGRDAPNVWCRGQDSTYYSSYWFNWAWDNVRSFAKLIETSSAQRLGPVGTVRVGLAYTLTGDEIAYTLEGSTAVPENLTHAMFVTGVSGTTGSRGIDNIKIAAHNNPTDTAFMALSSYAPSGLSTSQFMTIHITGAAYDASVDPIT